MKLEVDKAELYTKECSGAGLNDLENPLIHDLTVVAISSWPFGPADCLLFTAHGGKTLRIAGLLMAPRSVTINGKSPAGNPSGNLTMIKDASSPDVETVPTFSIVSRTPEARTESNEGSGWLNPKLEVKNITGGPILTSHWRSLPGDCVLPRLPDSLDSVE